MSSQTFFIPEWARAEIQDGEIKRLSRRDDRYFLVFINSQNEVDWLTSSEMDDKKNEDEVLNELMNSTQSRIQVSYNKIPDYIPKDSRIYALLIDILAEAMVCSLSKDKDLVTLNFKNFDDYISSFIGQHVRGYMLVICAWSFLFVLLVMFLTKINELSSVFIEVFKIYAMVNYSMSIGVIGAIFSILMKNTQIGNEFYSERLIMRETLAKIAAGGIAGCAVYFFMKASFIPFSLKEDVAFLCISFLAGFSERFVPDILSKKKMD